MGNILDALPAEIARRKRARPNLQMVEPQGYPMPEYMFSMSTDRGRYYEIGYTNPVPDPRTGSYGIKPVEVDKDTFNNTYDQYHQYIQRETNDGYVGFQYEMAADDAVNRYNWEKQNEKQK